jgi:hypothetical protein
MGYSHFSGNQEDLMQGFLHYKKVKKSELTGYPDDVKSLIRKKMIVCDKDSCSITERGKNAITQQTKTGEYWVGSLKPYKFKPQGSIKISRELVGYIK